MTMAGGVGKDAVLGRVRPQSAPPAASTWLAYHFARWRRFSDQAYATRVGRPIVPPEKTAVQRDWHDYLAAESRAAFHYHEMRRCERRPVADPPRCPGAMEWFDCVGCGERFLVFQCGALRPTGRREDGGQRYHHRRRIHDDDRQTITDVACGPVYGWLRP